MGIRLWQGIIKFINGDDMKQKYKFLLLASASFTALAISSTPGYSEDSGSGSEAVQLPDITVQSSKPDDTAPPADGSAAAGYRTKTLSLGAMGTKEQLDTPYTVNTIPQAMIENTQANSLEDLLRYIPSTQFDQRFSDDWGRLQTRGFQSNMDNVYIDGIPANGNPLAQLPAQEFGGLEVMNGVSAFAYGPSLPAGVFNISTKKPLDTPYHSITTGYTSNAQYFVMGDYSDHVGPNDAIGYRINVMNGDGEGYVKTSNLRQTYGSIALDFKLSDDTRLGAYYSRYAYNASGYPGFFGMTASTTPMAKAPDTSKAGYGQPWSQLRDSAELAELTLKHDFSENWTFNLGLNRESSGRDQATLKNTLTYNAQTGTYSNKQTISAIPVGYVDTVTYGDAGTLTGKFETGPIKHEATFGVIGNWQPATWAAAKSSGSTCSNGCTLGTTSYDDPAVYSNSSSYWYYYGGKSYTTGSSYKQSAVVGDKIDLTDQWSVMFSVAETWIGVNYLKTATTNPTSSYLVTGTSPTYGLMYKPIKPVMFYATYSEGINQGEVAAATATSASGVANVKVTNAYQSLQPTTSKQYEMGNKIDWGAISTTVDGFRISRGYSEYIDNGNNTLTLTAAGEQLNYGVETMVTGKVTKDLTLVGGVTWLDPSLTKTLYSSAEGKQTTGVPTWQGNLYAEYALRFLEGLSVNANIHYTGERPANDANTQWVDGYTTLDLGTRYETKIYDHPTTFRLTVKNVTNERYWQNVVDSSTSGSAATTASQLMAGDPLTLTASVQVQF